MNNKGEKVNYNETVQYFLACFYHYGFLLWSQALVIHCFLCAYFCRLWSNRPKNRSNRPDFLKKKNYVKFHFKENEANDMIHD